MKHNRRALRQKQIAKAQSELQKQAQILDSNKDNIQIQRNAVRNGVELLKKQGEDISKIIDFNWNQLIEIHDKMASGIYSFANGIAESMQAIQAAGKADVVFLRIVQTAMVDSQTFTDRLVELRKQMNNRTGQITSTDDLPDYYQIADKTYEMYDNFMSLAYQSAQEITSALSQLEQNEKNFETIVDNAINPKEVISNE